MRNYFPVRWGEIGCLTSQLTIFQSYMWRHIDVQADWRRSWTYGRAPNAIDISYGSLTCSSKHRHGTTLFIRWFRHTAPFSRLLRSRWGYGGHILDLTPGPSRGNYFQKRPFGASLHILTKLYDVPVGFVTPYSSFEAVYLLYLRSPKGGCCSISDDLSCSHTVGVT